MCGIVGYVGKREVIGLLVKGLKTLEYRGYDSAGVAYFQGAKVHIKKSEGKLGNLQALLEGARANSRDSDVQCGIGHTRWATHGKPTTQNAHPHRTGSVILVHNGIIENYLDIHKRILALGYTPESETDSELYGFLVVEEMKRGTPFIEAVRKSFLELQGNCSVVVMCEDEPNVVVGIRNGSPLVAAVDPMGGGVLASDAQPILEFTQEVIFLNNGEMAVATFSESADGTGGVDVFDLRTGKPLASKTTRVDWTPEKIDKRGYAHYMLKEIHEQPQVIVDTLNGVLDRARPDPFPFAEQPGVEILRKAKELVIVGCGTSFHTAMLSKYWLEQWAGIPVNVELSSEYRYRDPVVKPGAVVVGISQSGETADTLAVVRDLKQQGVPTIGVTNVRGSTLSREADAVFFTSAGPEISVLATKSFTANNIVLFLWAGCLGLQRALASGKSDRDSTRFSKIFDQVVKLPHLVEQGLLPDGEMRRSIQKAAGRFHDKRGFFFIGRGYSFPVALEAALKLKEGAYLHAEGYAAGELKHGPIAMIDSEMVVVVLAPEDRWREKTVSNLQEVKARGALILGIGNPGDEATRAQCDEWVSLPHPEGWDLDPSLYPFLLSPVVQLFAYEIALLRGTNIDQPRNLAKSVTVE